MNRVALYARYSSDNQREASIEDQFCLCRIHAERQGWQVVESYYDRAVSGAGLIRSGIQGLLADALRGSFDVVLVEALDRLSRDQEDVAGVYMHCVAKAAMPAQTMSCPAFAPIAGPSPAKRWSHVCSLASKNG